MDSDPLYSETVLSLPQAARRLPHVRGKKHPHPNTVRRWAFSGLKSKSGILVNLESWILGGTRVTSLEALERFFQRLDDITVLPMPSNREKAIGKQAEEAIDILRDRGIIKDEKD